jgi:hypothetical protein
MALSLLFIAWMFTFTESDPRTKDPMSFPARIFTLPISTPFLLNWLRLAGLASVLVVYEIWNHLVQMPHVEMFAPFQNVSTWMTLLVLTQGIAWALAGWPLTRMFILSGVLTGFLYALSWQDVFDSPFFLSPVFLLGLALGGVGMKKMRHGQWQGWTRSWPFASASVSAELRGPTRFASPAQAQLWFEWRRFASRLCWLTAALGVVPVALHLLVRGIFGLGPLMDNTMTVFVFYLLALPVMLHFCFALAPPRGDLPFLMNRPLTTGEMTMASLQATGISTLVSWGVVLASLCAMPFLGDFHALVANFSFFPQNRALLVLGLMLLTWRMIPSSLGFVLSGHKRLAEIPVWMFLGLCVVWGMLAWLAQVGAYWNAFWHCVPALLMALIALKIYLAFLAFRLCLKRCLLAPSALAGYLTFWMVLVAVLIALVVILPRPPLQDILPSSLAVILLVPLARIGFCPIALAWNRHA